MLGPAAGFVYRQTKNIIYRASEITASARCTHVRAPQLAIGTRPVLTLYKKLLDCNQQKQNWGARRMGPYWGLHPVSHKLLGTGPQLPQWWLRPGGKKVVSFSNGPCFMVWAAGSSPLVMCSSQSLRPARNERRVGEYLASQQERLPAGAERLYVVQLSLSAISLPSCVWTWQLL